MVCKRFQVFHVLLVHFLIGIFDLGFNCYLSYKKFTVLKSFLNAEFMLFRKSNVCKSNFVFHNFENRV